MKLYFFNGLIIGLLTVAIPLAFLFGKHTASGVAQEYIVASYKCNAKADKLQAMLLAVKGK